VVSYATEVKIAVLGVPRDLVEQHGVISEECALAMAQGAARLTGSSYGVATTGVAGPDRQEDHPPGTVHVAVHGPGGGTARRLALTGDRAAVQDQTCLAVLSVLRGILTGEEGALR
jgi:PncC family amidohydrolase